MKISVITLFPAQINDALNYSITKRALEKGKVEINIVDHREFGIGPHKIVDDKPYGGGAGMILRVDVLKKAIDFTKRKHGKGTVILLDPQGITYNQQKAEEFLKSKHIILVCGHYEGFDERVRDLADLELSIGDFVLTGGEIPSLVIIDSIVRLLPGVLKDPLATKNESYSQIDGVRLLEGPQYTRPEDFGGTKVPDIYLSGDPKKILQFKREKAMQKTLQKRPDLIENLEKKASTF